MLGPWWITFLSNICIFPLSVIGRWKALSSCWKNSRHLLKVGEEVMLGQRGKGQDPWAPSLANCPRGVDCRWEREGKRKVIPQERVFGLFCFLFLSCRKKKDQASCIWNKIIMTFGPSCSFLQKAQSDPGCVGPIHSFLHSSKVDWAALCSKDFEDGKISSDCSLFLQTGQGVGCQLPKQVRKDWYWMEPPESKIFHTVRNWSCHIHVSL